MNIRPISVPFASPPHLDEGMHFVPPELPAETLLDKEHNETLAKLNFTHALVESIMSVAETRASPFSILTESACKKVS
jgi:serine/threonine-protein kinase ULK/ATG1